MTPKPSEQQTESRESLIEDAIIDNPDQLGFPGALAIRRCRIAEPCGLIDLVLLPRTGPIRLVLIEAKASHARDAASKVMGQLLMYYGGALMLGSDGLDRLRDFASQHEEIAKGKTKISPKALTGGLTPPTKAWKAMSGGTLLKPDEIQLFIALDGEPHRAFAPTLRALSQHGLRIGYCIVRNGAIDFVTSRVAPQESNEPCEGSRSHKPAKKSDWRTEPLPAEHATIELNRSFTSHEMQKIQAGLVPEEMEDKWFIYWSENTLHFHRSWTGNCIFVVRFAKDGDSFRMVQADVNRDPRQWKDTSDSHDAAMISHLIDVLLLKRPSEFPGGDHAMPEAAIMEWSVMGKAMLGEERKPGPGNEPSKGPDSR